MSIKLNGKCYRTVGRPAILYGLECWAVKGQEQNMQIAEMDILRYMSGVFQKDSIRNDSIRGSLGVVNIRDKMREHRLRWFAHVMMRWGEEKLDRAIQGLQVSRHPGDTGGYECVRDRGDPSA